MKKLFRLACLLLFVLTATSMSGAAPKDYHYSTVPNDSTKSREFKRDPILLFIGRATPF